MGRNRTCLSLEEVVQATETGRMGLSAETRHGRMLVYQFKQGGTAVAHRVRARVSPGEKFGMNMTEIFVRSS